MYRNYEGSLLSDGCKDDRRGKQNYDEHMNGAKYAGSEGQGIRVNDYVNAIC